MIKSGELYYGIKNFIDDNAESKIAQDDFKKGVGSLIKKYVVETKKKNEFEALLSFKSFIQYLFKEEGSSMCKKSAEIISERCLIEDLYE